MEIHLKSLVRGVVLLFFFSLGVLALLAILASAPKQTIATAPLPPVQPSIFPTGTPQSGAATQAIEISLADSSASWNWELQEVCKPVLEHYLRTRYAIRRVEFTLVDDKTSPVGVAYPDVANAQAMVMTDCTGQDGALTCHISPSSAQNGNALNVATAVAALYGVQEFYRPKVKAAWESQKPWDWSNFQPLINKEQTEWHSNCVTVSAQ